ncbi:hypothetical protein HOLleu_28569 [Holothuria leucospilota]|uniref:Uncharacterized protein n=1 Tax=Holothuria leucospilota TaxID=206669 RepID=A0A9Q1BM58_HOLLE|nr:hypothetical protein HOLleu_28569 [Holothuria leucospilota]
MADNKLKLIEDKTKYGILHVLTSNIVIWLSLLMLVTLMFQHLHTQEISVLYLIVPLPWIDILIPSVVRATFS